MSTAFPDDWAYVPVPAWLLAEVLAWLSERLRATSGTAAGSLRPEPPPAASARNAWDWPSDLLERAVRESVGTMLTILDLLVGRAGEWVTQAELREATGKTDRQLAGTWGQFTKRCQKYGHPNDWPFETGSTADGYTVRLSRESAEIVRRVRADMPA